jgi:hypothetical protein
MALGKSSGDDGTINQSKDVAIIGHLLISTPESNENPSRTSTL